MKILLGSIGASHDPTYPLLYKNKIPKVTKKGKYSVKSPLQTALDNNQVRAVEVMIEYIVKYQNDPTSSFLVVNCLHTILEKGISLTSLCNSKVFMHSFDFDEWASVSTSNKTVMKPYHGDIFTLR
jgi:acyl-CoA thioesterase